MYASKRSNFESILQILLKAGAIKDDKDSVRAAEKRRVYWRTAYARKRKIRAYLLLNFFFNMYTPLFDYIVWFQIFLCLANFHRMYLFVSLCSIYIYI